MLRVRADHDPTVAPANGPRHEELLRSADGPLHADKPARRSSPRASPDRP